MGHSPTHQSAGDFVHGVEEEWVGMICFSLGRTSSMQSMA